MAPVPHNRLTFDQREIDAVAAVIASGNWAGGNVVWEMESRFASLAGVKHACATSSGISALRLALQALQIGPGDRVAVPAYSCVALPNAVLACGGIPVPLDVEEGTWNLSPAALAAEKNLRAAIVVHTFGLPADFAKLRATGVPLIEDCSHGFGRVGMGSLGDVSMLSLYATKLIGAGQGGVVLTNDDTHAAFLRDASDYVDKPMAVHRQRETMSAPEAALALCQLDRLPDLLARRDALAARYDTAFGKTSPKSDRVWYRYTITVPDAASFTAQMEQQGIHAASPVENWCETPLPVATRAFREIVSLPLYPTLTEEEQDLVIEAAQTM
ncbi:MAG: DegT/DnrJ/EryC1/StrS family aminotransferase [Verrucomicrobiaceae bacterium]|nr:DegT/DnrJ/EryC1/StrS family aminotransferase [Verrucomicrobiaceae bacterium]